MWGPFLIKQSVVCRSKMSLTCGPLQIVVLASWWHPKSIKFEVISWCKFDRFWEWWDKQCIQINSRFSVELNLFQQLCCSGVVGYQQVQTNFLRAFPVPLPRQVFLSVYFGVHIWANSCKYVAKNGVALEHCRTHVLSNQHTINRDVSLVQVFHLWVRWEGTWVSYFSRATNIATISQQLHDNTSKYLCPDATMLQLLPWGYHTKVVWRMMFEHNGSFLAWDSCP